MRRIEFSGEFSDTAAALGIRRSHAEAAIRSHDQLQVIKDEGLELLIHAKWISNAHVPFLLLVMGQVTPQGELVLWALKALSDLCNDIRGSPPLEVVRSIAERFGDPLRIGDRTAKFFLQERIPVKDLQATQLVEQMVPSDHSMTMSMFVRLDRDPSPCARVALAFCIRTDEYAEWANGQV
jgi:hypothetical protein